MRTAWLILGVTLGLLLVMELTLRGFFGIKDLGSSRPPDPRVLNGIPNASGWLPQHYRELESLSDRWQPYVYFRQRPFDGQTIHIDENGLRATWKPPGLDGEMTKGGTRPVKILMLGGSSLWGYGARDDRTIPSLVAQGLHDRKINAEITNLAEIGYVNTQEMIALIRELQRGDRPDVVLFYDGVNDTTSALLEGQATLTTNEVNRRREFNLLQSPPRLAGALGWKLIEDSASFRLASSLGRRIGLEPPRRLGAKSGQDEAQLARDVVRGYLANLETIRVLGTAYGFRPLFVWQPVIFEKHELVPFETEEAEKFGWARGIFAAVNAEIHQSAGLREKPDFLDLSRIFSEDRGLVFLDFCHTTEEANARIADRLIAVLVDLTSNEAFLQNKRQR